MVVAVVLVGCGSSGSIKSNRTNLLKLEIGMSKAEAISIMGTPFKNESYETKNGGQMDFYMYRTDLDASESRWTDAELTPLCFIDNKLKGWGRNFYDDTIKIRKEIIRD